VNGIVSCQPQLIKHFLEECITYVAWSGPMYICSWSFDMLSKLQYEGRNDRFSHERICDACV
jgi:hypothetical protein